VRLLDKYLFRELLVPLGYCLSGFLICLATADLYGRLDDFQDANTPAALVFRYVWLTVPESLVRVLPIALLLALLYALTNHARHHELTAIRAAGVSLWRLSLPYFTVGAVLSGASFLINEFWVPSASEEAQQILDARPRRGKTSSGDQVRNLLFVNARDNRSWQIGSYQVKAAAMSQVRVDWVLPDQSRREYYAEQGSWTNGVWVLTRLELVTYPPGANLHTNHAILPFYEAKEFNETPEQIKSEIAILGMSQASRRAEVPLFQILNYLRLHPTIQATLSSWLRTQLHGRIAEPFTCLVVVLIALPFGARSGRRNVFVGVAASIFIVFSFYVLMSLGLALGTRGWLPPWLGAWLPNLSFTTASLWLIRRVR
jgi:lipopolysaccharide export system permease protein